MKISENDVVRRSENLLTSKMDDELVMMNLEKGEYYGLNVIATRIWSLLEQPQSIEQLINCLTDEFDVSRDKCLNDIAPFLENLMNRQIIEIQANA